MKRTNRSGRSIDPCGTPDSTSIMSDVQLSALLEKPDTNWLHFGYNQNVTKMQPKRNQNATKT